MRAPVDPNRCDNAGICVVICPEVFRFHEGSKKAYVTRSEIPKNLEEKCLEAAQKCPNKAIIILRDQGQTGLHLFQIIPLNPQLKSL